MDAQLEAPPFGENTTFDYKFSIDQNYQEINYNEIDGNYALGNTKFNIISGPLHLLALKPIGLNTSQCSEWSTKTRNELLISDDLNVQYKIVKNQFDDH